MKLLIPLQLQKLVDNKQELEVDNYISTISSLISWLKQYYPSLYERLTDKDANLNKFINWYVNDEDIRFLAGENTELSQNDIISLIPAIAGG